MSNVYSVYVSVTLFMIKFVCWSITINMNLNDIWSTNTHKKCLHTKINYGRQQRGVQYQYYDWSQFRYQLTQQDPSSSIVHLVIASARSLNRQQLVN